VNKYILTLKHDNGKVNLIVTAQNFEQAIRLAREAEGCPERSIVNIKVVYK
jgi:hypothetical protein